MKKLGYAAASLLVLLPIIPFAGVYYIAMGIANAMVWCCDRNWADKLKEVSADLAKHP